MKYKLSMLIIFILSIISINKVYAYFCDIPLLGKIIYLDAGHGGRDPGAKYNDIAEKDLTLEIVKKLKKELEGLGATVLLTRDGDYDLSSKESSNKKRNDLLKRVNSINNSKCDIYLSIHLNAYPSDKWRGLQIFYDQINPKNKILANVLTDTLKTELKNIREIKNVNNYYMYSRINIPGVLIETGFITNSSDLYLLKNEKYQQKLAKTISKGVINYFNN